MLRARTWFAVLGAIVAAASAARAEPKTTYVRACPGPGVRCGALLAMQDGVPARPPSLPTPSYRPADLQAAYHIDPTLGAGVTIAIVDAYGYKNLASDLAMYRSHYNLPACTVDNGCLRIVNEDGAASPLPTDTDAGWEAETALDMDMVSAACPLCNILVVQTEPGKLDAGVRGAQGLLPDAISASWGSIENGGEIARELTYDHPGIGVFAASGDNAYDSGGDGPEYPATSQYVVAVGGTRLVKSSVGGVYAEGAWSLAGSSCSKAIATPSYQPAAASAACGMRASSDLSAVADPSTGVAVYESSAGGFLNVGGTSAATPLVAALMAAAGHGDATPAFVYRHPEAFRDVTTGMNGDCGTALCTAGAGWDGPTGLGTPDQSVLATIGGGVGPALTITSPATGSMQDAGFAIHVSTDASTAHVDLAVDGVRVAVAGPPFTLTVPAGVTLGLHDFTVTAFDGDHNAQRAAIQIDVQAGGCSTSGGAGGISLGLVGVALVTSRRRRRDFSLNM